MSSLSIYILQYLRERRAFLKGHFVFTSKKHGRAYINVRKVAHDASWLARVSMGLGDRIAPYAPDVILGPETLGRTLAGYAGEYLRIDAIWCDMDDDPSGAKVASFSPKLDFGRLIKPGTRVAIVDDLLTSGSSIRAVADLVSKLGGEVVVAAVVLRRSLDVGADACKAPELEVLAEVEGFEVFTPEECAEFGPCSEGAPMILRPGHGHKWIKDHPMYPVAKP